MDINELKANVDKLSRQVQQETKDLPVLSTLFSALFVIFTSLFALIDNQTKVINKQTKVIENLTDQLANKTLNSKRANDENINGCRSERNKGVDSSDKGRKDDLPKSRKNRPGKEVKVEHRKSYIGYKGKELTAEEAEALIGTVFEGDDGKKYRYTRKLDSSVKAELQVNLIETQYYKLEYVEIDEQGQEVAGTKETAVSAKTDFLKKKVVSVHLMAWIFYLWIGLKSPINRISIALSEYGLKLSKQQLNKNIGIVAVYKL